MVRGVVKRRQADPRVVLQLWDVITSIRAGKQVANYDRVIRYMQRKHNVNSKETQKQVSFNWAFYVPLCPLPIPHPFFSKKICFNVGGGGFVLFVYSVCF